MKLYVCYGTFRAAPRPGGRHPCGSAFHALREAGHDPQVVRVYGWGALPGILNNTAGRREVQRLSGNRWVPTLELDDGTVVDGTESIVQWARAHPAVPA